MNNPNASIGLYICSKVAFLLLLLLTGCASYEAQPLQSQELDQRMQSPSHEMLMLEAAKLNRPRLNPIKLDFSQPLTEDELAVIAVLTNPDLKALRARQNVADAQVFSAGLLPDPQISLALDFPSSSSTGLVTAYNLGLNWALTTLVTRPVEKHIANARAQQVRYDIAWQEWMLSNQVRLLARRISYLQRQLLLAQEASNIAESLFTITKQNVEAGDVKIDELSLRNVAFLDAQGRYLSLARDVEKTRQELNQTLGLEPSEQLALAPVVNDTLIETTDAAGLFSRARQQRLDLLALKAGYESQEATLYRAVLGQYPAFSLGLNTARDTSNVHTQGIGVGLDIPIFNRNRGNIAIASSTREQLHVEYASRLQQTRADIATLVADIQRIEQERLLLLQELPELVREESVLSVAAKNRDVTLINYETVRASLLDKQLKLLSLEQVLAEQQIALQISVGSPLNHSPKSPL